MKLRVGLIGLGSDWKTRHQPALRALGDRFEIRAVCEPVAHRAEAIARECGADAVDGFRAISQRSDVDAVIVLCGGWYGELPILAACDEGKALYCAAALDLSLAQARQLRRRIDEAGIAFMAEFPRRHAPATLRLKELIATKLGTPKLLFCHHRAAKEIELSAGDAAAHRDADERELVELIDWCCYVVGADPVSVTGVAHYDDAAADAQMTADYRMLSVAFPGATESAQVIAQISTGRYMDSDWPEAVTFRPPSALQVACENGVAFLDPPATLTWFDSAGRHMESLESERPIGERLLLDFHRAATSLVRKSASLDDAYRAMVVAESAARSFAEGRRIDLQL
ncbi:MAG: Gfo/Idh/MocA family oxidoreductase [Pirellulales bacterium]|nr:Gfo/Idh/MocA family oxidoreductase [Pirellulales bacterium]